MERVPSILPPPEAVVPERHPEAPAPGEAIPSHYSYCIGCGDKAPNGLRMVTTAGEGLTLTSRFTVTEGHQGAPGLAHGGLLSLAFDDALGSLNYLIRQPAVTARLETEFLKPVPVGSVLEIQARIDGKVGRKLYLSAEGYIAGQSDPALKARALFISVPLEHFVKNANAEVLNKIKDDPSIRKGRPGMEINP